jgi:alpha-1,3-rhamnosyl/mannosyltransferase
MLWGVPMALGRLGPAHVHFHHALPLRCPTPAVVTVHDLSFERGWKAMPVKDTLAFRATVRLAVRRARRVIAVSERTKRDLIELYGTAEAKVVVIPHGVGSAFSPATDGAERSYLLFVGAIQERKDPLAAADAAVAVGLPLVVVGPEKEPKLARELEQRGAELRGYVEPDALAELYRGAAALVLPSRYEGFGLPVLEAMASGTPVVAAPDPALREVAGDAALYADRAELADAVRRAVSDPAPLSAAGLERARRFSWEDAARRTVEVYLEAIA